MPGTRQHTGRESNLTDELAKLQAEELRLKIKELSLKWWQRPSYLGALATIILALTGFIWGMATGFFDVAKRELKVSKKELEQETRDLQSRRDKQSRAYEEELAQREKTITVLAKREAQLRERIEELDRPILGALFLYGCCQKEIPSRLKMLIEGFELGDSPGKLVFSLNVPCYNQTLRVTDDPSMFIPHIESWSNRRIDLELETTPSLQAILANASRRLDLRKHASRNLAGTCDFALWVSVIREIDEKPSNLVRTYLNGALRRVLAGEEAGQGRHLSD